MEWKSVALCLSMIVGSVATCRAATADYFFFGTGAGAFDGVPFGVRDFSFLLHGDTAAIVATPDHYTLTVTGGLFSEGGANGFALAGSNVIALSTEPGSLSIGFDNLAFTGGFQILNQPALADYDLAGPFRALADTAGDINVNTGSGFALVGNQEVAFTSISRLGFAATPIGLGETAVPEPPAGLLLASACGVLLMATSLRRRPPPRR